MEWKKQKLRRIAYVVVLFLLMTGCRREVQKTSPVSREKIFTGNYSAIDNYKVMEGSHTGFKGQQLIYHIGFARS